MYIPVFFESLCLSGPFFSDPWPSTGAGPVRRPRQARVPYAAPRRLPVQPTLAPPRGSLREEPMNNNTLDKTMIKQTLGKGPMKNNTLDITTTITTTTLGKGPMIKNVSNLDTAEDLLSSSSSKKSPSDTRFPLYPNILLLNSFDNPQIFFQNRIRRG